MCDICEGKEPIPELYEGYTPGPIWFGTKGVIGSWKVFGTITDKIDSDTVTNELKVPPCTFTGSAI